MQAAFDKTLHVDDAEPRPVHVKNGVV
jgi:hypothetical protein